GANLVTALTVAATMHRPEPFARDVFETGVVPRAVLPACGLLQVSDPERFARRKQLPTYIRDRIEEVSQAYLGRGTGNIEMADPRVVRARDPPSQRSIPPFFTFVGTRDPILDDTRRLHAALLKRSVPCEIRYFPGEAHAFHALMWRPSAIDCWRSTHAWLKQHVPDRISHSYLAG